ncbi:MAG: PKD domain-containing protein [Thermoplasmata archaeon]|nr:MAG: PKD domain-containing protein [Thermoplasmata archaeon]
MAKDKEEKVEDEKPKPSVEGDSSGKMKIIAIVVVVVVIIAIAAYYFIAQEGEDNGNGDGDGDNRPPIAEISLSQNDFFVNQIVYFNSTSKDPDGDTLTHEWDFGDGESSTEANTTHIYTATGEYTVNLTVKDEHDEPDHDTVTINVRDIPATEFNVQKLSPTPPSYTVTITSITTSIDAELVHFYVIDGDTDTVIIEGNVAAYETPTPPIYVDYNDANGDGNLSENDNFLVKDDLTGSMGINDGDKFKLTMEGSPTEVIGETPLQ